MSKHTTIYRKCGCGETAHDMRAERIESGWSYVYACRNCGALAKNRQGITKCKVQLDDGTEYCS